MYILKDKVSKWKQINFRNVDSMLSVQFLYDLYDQYDAKINWFRFKNVCLYYQNDKLWSYTPNDDWEKALDNIASQFKFPNNFSNPNIIDNCYNYCKIEKTLLLNLMKEIDGTDISSLTNKELYDLLDKWYQITLNQIYYINVAPVELGLQRAINELSNLNNIPVYDISILYSLDDNTEVLSEELQLLTSIKENNYKLSDDLIYKHWLKYKHLTIGYGSSEMSIELIKERALNAIQLGKDKIDQRINEIQRYPHDISEKKEISKKNIKDKHLIKLFDLAAKLGILRDHNKALLGKSVSYRNEIIRTIANNNHMQVEDFKFYLLEDMKNYLYYDILLDDEEINKRKNGIYISHTSQMFTGDESRENYYSSVRQEMSEKITLDNSKGICASAGHARGIAKVCLTFEECNKLKDNEILITYGTDFNFLNAMVKSNAIVTEEGGILSHASVISRELKKPCIIGFKNITKLIKDGDEIEVDANNGTVKILNKQDELAHNLIPGIYDMSEPLEASEVGNKAYNINILKMNSFNVPKACVLGVSFFKNLLKSNNKFDEYMNYAANIKKYEKQLFELIDNLNYPIEQINSYLDFEHDTYAVRSSSLCEDGFNKSFAGQFVTELFCNSIEFVINSIKTCWKSFLNKELDNYSKDERYCFGGIIIQKMITADYSGVLFTKDPVSNNNNMIIECCNGVASKLVDNKVDPSRFYVRNNDYEIIKIENDINIPNSMIIELAEICNNIKKIYEVEIDVEWAVEKGELYIIQCRPITTFNFDL